MSEHEMATIIRPNDYGEDTDYEPPLQIGFGIDSNTIENPVATMGKSILPPGRGNPNPAHYHVFNDVCQYIISGKIKCTFSASDGSNRREEIAEAGDFVYIPRRTIHIIENASDTEEASLIFCYPGVPSKDAAETIFTDGHTG